jgi:uncharacterized SAM-binding protein YcdF (DUF218 family)
MEFGSLKPVLTALVLPPAGPLLLAAGAALLGRRWRPGRWVAVAALLMLWLLACHGLAVRLAGWLLPLPAVVEPAEVRRAGVQAVIVLGGGVLPDAPEYGSPQPSAATVARLRYGIRLARASALPLGFSGGVGWAGSGRATEAEAVVEAARRDFDMRLRWVDDRSRDTRENARQMAQLLRRDGVSRIALVSDSWHLPRAVAAFQAEGLQVVAAPTRLPRSTDRPVMEWLPSTRGLELSQQVLREWLAGRVAA